MATLHGMWDFRISWLGPEPRSPALGAWSLNQWITREVPLPYFLTSLTFKAQSRLYLANILKAQGSVRALIFNFYCLWPLRKSPLSCFSLASLKNLFKCFTHHLNYFKWKSQLRNLATQLLLSHLFMWKSVPTFLIWIRLPSPKFQNFILMRLVRNLRPPHWPICWLSK